VGKPEGETMNENEVKVRIGERTTQTVSEGLHLIVAGIAYKAQCSLESAARYLRSVLNEYIKDDE
jgi:hypothetical protein